MPLARGFDNLFIAADDDFAGRRALQRAHEIRPDVVHLKFANGADANETIRQSGADTSTASSFDASSSNNALRDASAWPARITLSRNTSRFCMRASPRRT